MKAHLRVLVLALAAMLSCPVYAQGTAGFTTFTIGDCGTWLRAKTPLMEAWVLGYLSGMARVVYDVSSANPLGKITSNAQVLAYMDRYCSQNPAHRPEQALDALWKELLKTQ